ncbi:MAG: LamG-like jellyroll fold domain-containing protein [Candidatus Pacearchaeota archaeon]
MKKEKKKVKKVKFKLSKKENFINKSKNKISKIKEVKTKPSEILDKFVDKKRKTNLLKIVITVVLLIILISLLIFVISLYLLSLKLKSENKNNLKFSEDISSVFVSKDLKSMYVQLVDKNRPENETYAKVKFLLRDLNGTEYIIETNKSINEIILSSVSVPLDKNILSILTQKKNYNFYNYEISINDVKGLNNFVDITYVSIILEKLDSIARNNTSNINNTNNISKNQTRTTTPSTKTTAPASPTYPATTVGSNCTNTPWENKTFRCNGDMREVRQTRILCASGNTEEKWIEIPCSEGYRCYEGPGYPQDRCINASQNCFDSDSGINSTVKGFVKISEIFFNDTCILETKNLTEFYCFYNGTNLIANNETIVCNFGCYDGSCLICTDADLDGYSIEGGNCGLVDCNDQNANINPGATEICGNQIDEDCSGSDRSCVDLDYGLVAHWTFDNNLIENVASQDKLGNYNATCIGEFCPVFKSDQGLNNSGTFEYDGVNDFFLLSPLIFNNQSYSISIWIKPKSPPINNFGTILYADAGATNKLTLLLSEDTSFLKITANNNYGLDKSILDTGENSIAVNLWNHIVFNYEYKNKSQNARIYLNGIEKAYDLDFLENPAPTRATIGDKIEALAYQFKGQIDEFRIYNRTLTQDEITTLYNHYKKEEFASLSLIDRLIRWIKSLF